MKINKNRFLAGAMALLIGCSTLFNAGVTVSAAETSIQETTVETEGMAEELPELSDVLDMLDADEIVTAEDIVLTVGDVFDEESDLTGIIFDDSKVKVTFKDAEDVYKRQGYLCADYPERDQEFFEDIDYHEPSDEHIGSRYGGWLFSTCYEMCIRDSVTSFCMWKCRKNVIYVLSVASDIL